MKNIPVLENLSAWTTPLFLCHLPEHGLIKSKLLQCIERLKNSQHQAVASEVADIAKHALYESQLDFLDTDDESVLLLKEAFQTILLMVAEEVNYGMWPENVNPQAKITESWFHVTENGGFHDVHSHPNCSWCGIYFVKTDGCEFSTRNGINRFYDPRINAEQYLDAGNLYINREGVWDIEPEDGQLVLFPSYLKHAALPYFGHSERVVIAFNAQIHFI